MASAAIYKVKLEGKCIGFVERELTYHKKVLSEVRNDLKTEIGELLPETFRFLRCEMPVSSKQENGTALEKCVVEDGKDNFGFLIQEVSQTEHSNSTKNSASNSNIPAKTAKPSSTSATAEENKPFEKTLKHAKHEVENAEDDLQLAKALLNSLEQAPVSRPWHGRANFTCKNCHFKGHKVSKPCDMPTCTGFNECGILSMHPDQKQEIKKAKQKVKSLSKRLKDKQDDLESLKLIKGRTKANFFSIMRPKLMSVDPIKYSNRQTLENDLRILAAACNHTVPGSDMNLEEAIRKKKEEGNRLKSSYDDKSPTREFHAQYRHGQSSTTQGGRRDYPSKSNISPQKRRNSDRDKGFQWRRNLHQQYNKSPPSRSSHTRTSHSPSDNFSFAKEHVPRSSSSARTSYSPIERFTPRSTNTDYRARTSYRSSTKHHYTSKSSYHSPVASSTPKHSVLNCSRDSHFSSINTISPSPAKSARREITFDDSLPMFTDGSFGGYTANTQEVADVLVQMSRKYDH